MKKSKKVSKNLNFPLLIALVCLLLTFIVWDRFLHSINHFDRIFTSHLILAAGTFFSVIVGWFLWERDKMLRELKTQKNFSECIIHSMKDSLIVLDQNKRIQHMNHSSRRLLGYPESKIQNKPFSVLTDVEMLKNFKHKNSYDYQETSYRDCDGKKIPVSLSCSEITDGKGTSFGTVCIAQDITKRKQQEEQITRSLKEKEVLLKEVHDRVKNNLQVINSMIRMQVRNHHSEETISLFDEIQDRILSVALIHEILYQAEDLARIEVSIYLRKLISSILQSNNEDHPKYRVYFGTGPMTLHIDQAIPCGLIFYELLTNCFNRISFEKESAEVLVKFDMNLNRAMGMISVTCHGFVFPEEFDQRDSSSFGVKLIQILVSQLRGTVAFNRQEPFEMSIQFPLISERSLSHAKTV